MQHEYKKRIKIKHVDLPELSNEVNATHVNCPSCSEKVIAANLNINDMVGKCDHCDSIFSFKKEVGNLHHNSFNDELEISVSHGPPILDIITLIAVPIGILIGSLLYFADGKQVGLYVLLGSVILMINSIYNIYKHRKTKTFVTIDKDSIEVIHRPKNFKKDVFYDRSDIEQLYIKGDPHWGGHAVYAVINDPSGQQHKKIVSGMPSLIKAKYIEQEMERHLGIKNKKVIGEIQ